MRWRKKGDGALCHSGAPHAARRRVSHFKGATEIARFRTFKVVEATRAWGAISSSFRPSGPPHGSKKKNDLPNVVALGTGSWGESRASPASQSRSQKKVHGTTRGSAGEVIAFPHPPVPKRRFHNKTEQRARRGTKRRGVGLVRDPPPIKVAKKATKRVVRQRRGRGVCSRLLRRVHE